MANMINAGNYIKDIQHERLLETQSCWFDRYEEDDDKEVQYTCFIIWFHKQRR